MMINDTVDGLVAKLDERGPVLDERDNRYRGRQRLRFTADEIGGDLKMFSVNICRLAVDAVAERMRVKRLDVMVRGRDVSDRATVLWRQSSMDQLLGPSLVDALAMGAVYFLVWVDRHGRPTITPESARQVAVSRDPVTGEVVDAVKRWYVRGPGGAVTAEHVVHYGGDEIAAYVREGAGQWTLTSTTPNPLGVVPVVPAINSDRVGDVHGYSVIDDLGHLVDALSKILADMLVASEDVARPRRWATGVELEESHPTGDPDDGFIADQVLDEDQAPAPPVVSPFESGNRMFTVESPDAKFGQLPGADLAGYRTAVDLLVQQIMAVSALPAHMMGITTSNPSSADAIRAAEASLTARAEDRITVLGMAVEHALALLVAVDQGVTPDEVDASVRWASPATKSTAQEADAVAKLHSLGIITTEEAREMMGIDRL